MPVELHLLVTCDDKTGTSLFKFSDVSVECCSRGEDEACCVSVVREEGEEVGRGGVMV